MAGTAPKTLEDDVAAAIGVAGVGAGSISALDLIAGIQRGLPIESVARVAETVAPGDPEFRHRLVARSTLARRRKDPGAPRLSPTEGERLARIARIWTLALDVWKEPAATRAFLAAPHPMLDGDEPLALTIGSDLGARMVEDLLGRLKYGTAA